MADCNAFERCKWLRHLGKIMVLIVLAFVALSFWAVVFNAYGPSIADQGASSSSRLGSLLVTILFTFLVCMLLWSYFVAVSNDPGSVPPGWMPFDEEQDASDELDRLAHDRTSSGPERLAGSSRPRYCRKCRAWKPPRAHHDSVTGKCVLKMDHYCVWIINCVGLLNYKAFLLFLLYSCLACGLATALLLGAFIRFLTSERGEETPPAVVFVAFVVDLAFTLCLIGFIAMHIRLVAANCTTIEMYEKRRVPQWPYDRGVRSNFHEVFGFRVARWFIPSYSKEEEAELLNMLLHTSRSQLANLKFTELAADL